MKRLLVLILLGLVCVAGAEFRTWTAADGSTTIEANFVRFAGKEAELCLKTGKRIRVPIAKLCEADRKYLAAIRSGKDPESDSSSSASADSASELPYKVGRVTGPVEAGADAHYFYYVPKSLKPGRKAPLLFYSNSGGGNTRLLQDIVKGAEMSQWILAISVESRNGREWDENFRSAELAVKQILKTLPVDDDRMYFTGNSGGGAQAFYNYDQLDGFGLMPSIGYIPNETSVPRGDCFIINGAWDYNRYTSAHARNAIGDTAIQRFHTGGHWDAPGWIMVEGMVWLEGKFLAKKGKRFPEVQEEYVAAVLEWIDKLKNSEAHRAYYWAVFLKEQLRLTPAQSAAVGKVVTVLGANRNNRLYVEGIAEIDEFACKKLSCFGTGCDV